jgi:DNA-binding NarL/FixJ family response regulator
MNTTCVLVTKQDSMLNRALTDLLQSSECELKIITSGANDVHGLIAETSKVKPDIVILGESTPLARMDVLGNLLMSYPQMRVVVVSEESNWLHIFDKKDKLMAQNSDLLDVLCAA